MRTLVDKVEGKKFLHLLHGKLSMHDGMVNWVALPMHSFQPPGVWSPIVSERWMNNVWISVCTFECMKRAYENVLSIPACWVDIDPPTAMSKKTLREWRDKALKTALKLKPSIVVASGKGWHLYWLFKMPIKLRGMPVEERRELIGRVTAVNRWLALAVGGDTACADPTRVMRLPGTNNPKPGADRCSITLLSEAQYQLNQLEHVAEQLQSLIDEGGEGEQAGQAAELQR